MNQNQKTFVFLYVCVKILHWLLSKNQKTFRIFAWQIFSMKKKAKLKKSRTRLYNPHDGSTRPAVQIHEDKRKKQKYKKINKFVDPDENG